MRYLGVAKKEKGGIALPDAMSEVEEGRLYEAVEIGGDILLMTSPLDRKRLALIEEFARQSMQDHRKTLEGLAR